MDRSAAWDATLRIVTSDLRGKSELELPLSGRGVTANDGDNGARVSRHARVVDDHTVEMTEKYPGDRKPFSVCRRILGSDGQSMRLEVKKRRPDGRMAAMRAKFARVADEAAPATA